MFAEKSREELIFVFRNVDGVDELSVGKNGYDGRSLGIYSLFTLRFHSGLTNGKYLLPAVPYGEDSQIYFDFVDIDELPIEIRQYLIHTEGDLQYSLVFSENEALIFLGSIIIERLYLPAREKTSFFFSIFKGGFILSFADYQVVMPSWEDMEERYKKVSNLFDPRVNVLLAVYPDNMDNFVRRSIDLNRGQ